MKAQMELKAYEHDMTRIHMHESHALRAHIAMKLTTSYKTKQERTVCSMDERGA